MGSWVLFPDKVIVFGVLHFIGVAIVLSYPLLEYRLPNLIGGFIVLFLGGSVENFTVDLPWLIWLGLTPAGFQTLDHFPLLPGLALPCWEYSRQHDVPDHHRKYELPDLSKNPWYLLLSSWEEDHWRYISYTSHCWLLSCTPLELLM
jgi:uncharacterized membrane protein